jgi:outer membrane protein assembly factor BamB
VLNNNIMALSKDGKKEWTYERNFISGTDGHSAPVVAPDGTIYLNTSHEPKLQAINPDGTLKWEFEAPSTSISNLMTPVIGQDGTLYFGGTSFWHCDQIPCPKYPPPSESYFYALDPKGNLKWQYSLQYAVSAPALLSEEGILYFPTEGGWLYALDTGTGQGLAKSGWPSRHYDAQNTANGAGVFLDLVEGGDFNNSGKLEIADAVALIGLSRFYPEHPALDFNADGQYSISDVIKLVLDMRYRKK